MTDATDQEAGVPHHDAAAAAEEEEDESTKYEDWETLQTIYHIKKTFKKRVCVNFLLDPKKRKCYCGYGEDEHQKGVPKDDKTTTTTKWSVETSTKPEATDAFGVVEFPVYGQKTAKYIRVDHETDVNALWTLMSENWQMGKPHLLISVTGGAQKLKTETSLKTTLKEVFRKGLIEAAQSTDAWIITGGTNTGVMKLVGDAIRAHTLKKGNRKPLVAIGIATWGCITNKEALVVATEESTSSAANRTLPMALYEVGEPQQGVNEAPLDPNHTHFILVDDGTQHHYGAEIKLRAALEEKISNMEACEVKIPIVCIVIEGGRNTIVTAKEAIEANTPVIVIEGSGRAADVLAYAYNRYTEPKEDAKKQQAVEANERLWTDLEPEIKQSCGEKDWEDVLGNIKSCLERRNMITVFSLEEKGSTGRIDHAIIMTLLRVKEGDKHTSDKIKLALAWDRIDVVKEHIYTDEAKLTADELKELAFTAIVNNRVDFVKFFLERGLRLNDLLHKSKINDFYDEAKERNKHMRNALKDTNTSDEELKDLGRLIEDLVDQLFDLTKLRNKIQKRESTRLPRFTKSVSATDDAAMDLFFWSILGRMQSMAIVFIYEAKETFALSLIGHLMLKNLLKKEKDSESKQKLQSQVDYFERLTAGLLTECYSSNQEMTIDLLVRPIPIFAGLTPLEIAAQANNAGVIAHQACQDLLTVIWMGGISADNRFHRTILLCIPPFFLLAPVFLKFREETPTIQRESAKDGAEDQKDHESSKGKSLEDRRVSAAAAKATSVATAPAGMKLNAELKENPRCLYWKRLVYFLTAPCIKFTFNCVSYAVFLLLYSVLLLTNFFPKISTEEIVLIVWVGTIVCEEIRQIVEGREGSSRKFRNYITNKWNWVDLIGITTFILGLVLRLSHFSSCEKCFFAARTVLAFSLMTFYFRILHMFSIFRQLGPKLVMIGKMMIDLFYFMTILMVFIISYAIAVNVILYPNQELKPQLVGDVLSGAWWSVYGEFNIDEVSGESCEPLVSQTSSAEECASLDYDDFNRTLCPGKNEKCPAIDWFGPIFLAIYALITNVLMINLLIAMFSNTFTKVEETADVIWKMQRYHLVREYESHPVLPPPLIVLEHLYRVIRAIISKLQSHRRANQGTIVKQSKKSHNRTFRMGFGDYYERDLLAWLKVNVEEYLLKKEAEDAAGDRLAKETNERFDQLYRRIEDSEQTRKSLEEKMNEIIRLLTSKT